MVVESRRFMGNTLTAHVHDADHETRNCRLGHISPGNRRWYDSLEEARSERDYEDCSWCMGSANGRRAVGAAASAGTA